MSLEKYHSITFSLIDTEAAFRAVFPVLIQIVPSAETPINVDEARAAWARSRDVGYRLYQAMIGGEIVGCISLTELRDPLFNSSGFRVNNFVIDRKWRGKGIADQMALAVKEIAEAEGKTVIVIETWPENRKANLFYQRKFGFRFLCERMIREIPTPTQQAV